MMGVAIYIIAYMVSCFFLYESEKNKRLSLICVFLGLGIPCILAGMRAYTVGVDIQTYILPTYNLAKEYNSFIYFFFYYKEVFLHGVKIPEFAYLFLVYFTTKIFVSVQFVLFNIHLMIVIPIYLGLKRLNKIYKISIWYGMLIFYFMFFNISLCVMRQYMSIAFVFLGTAYLLTGSKKKFFLYCFIGFLFHSAAVVSVIIYMTYIIMNKKNDLVLKISESRSILIKDIKYYLSIFVSVIVVLSFNKLTSILSYFNLDYYAKYIDSNIANSTSNAMKFLREIPFILLILATSKGFKSKNKNAQFYLLLYIYNVIILLFSINNAYFYRIAYYFSIFNTILFPSLILSLNNKPNKIIYSFCLFTYLGIYWYYFFVFIGRYGTVPYQFF